MKIIILVTSRNLKYGPGMNRVIYNSQIILDKEFEKNIIVYGNTFLEFIKGFIKIIINNPFTFDYIIFNSLASVRSKMNRYWTWFFFISNIFKINKAIYWHEMPNYYIKFKETNPKDAKKINNFFKNNETLHLTCSIYNTEIAKYFNPKPKIKIINNCIIANNIIPFMLFSEYTVITVGSIQEIKGVDIWTKVAINTCLKNQKIKFIWCGSATDINLKNDCEKVIIKNNLQDRISFLGSVEDAKFLTKASHLYFSSSRIDTFPLAVLEAMNFGKNIVYYKSGGIEEQVGKFGLFVDNFDIDITVKVILSQYDQFVNNPKSVFNRELYNRFIENYTPEVFVNKFKKALMDI